jgi:hypothetical protein
MFVVAAVRTWHFTSCFYSCVNINSLTPRSSVRVETLTVAQLVTKRPRLLWNAEVD